MAVAMRNKGISAALMGCLALAGCQSFTAGETVSEPDPAVARKTREQVQKAQGEDVKAKQAEPAAHIEQATASHILIRYAGAARTTAEITRTKEDARKLAEDVAQKAALPGADFAALANQYTEDPSGKGRGGKLGTFPKGRMVPEFDSALFALRPGETSGVIETAFGFHVIQREN